MRRLTIVIVLMAGCACLGFSDTPSTAVDPLLGSWNGSADGFAMTYTFNADGTYSENSTKGSQNIIIKGGFTESGSQLTLTTSGGSSITVNYSISGNTLTVTGVDKLGANATLILTH